MPNFNLQRLIRPHLLTLKPYSSARSEFSGTADVFLDANENAFGSPTTQETNNEAPNNQAAKQPSSQTTNFNRYPDPLQKRVKACLSAIKGIDADKIFLGNGSDEAIDLLIRAFCEPSRDSILITPPTYGMYEVSADIHNVQILRAPLSFDGKAYTLDAERVLGAVAPNTKLLFLCSPGNPTGNCFDAAAIRRIIAGFQGIVVLDEAYIDFAPERSFVAELHEHPNLAIMQTLSKAWGLAALRLGMLFAAPEIIRVLNNIKPPYNVNAVTQDLALQALEREAWKNDVVALTLKERSRIAEALPTFACVEAVFASDANFLLVKVTKPREIYAALVQQGIIVRDRSSVPLCEGCLRITVGTSEENTRLLQTLERMER